MFNIKLIFKYYSYKLIEQMSLFYNDVLIYHESLSGTFNYLNIYFFFANKTLVYLLLNLMLNKIRLYIIFPKLIVNLAFKIYKIT